MKIGILQPGYLPWLGFFEQMYISDVFVIYDDVQYDKEGWRNRNRIKGPNGIQWLTVPVYFKLSDRQLIHEIKIDNKINWRKKHFTAFSTNYARAPFFKKYIEVFQKAYEHEWKYLVDIDMFFITKMAECLGMNDKKIIRSSSLNIKGDRIERLVNICKMFKADIFYEGASGKNYIDESSFTNYGIKVEFQDYKHPTYKQLYGDFIPYLSVIDLLFNYGEDSLSVLINKKAVEV